MRSIRPCATSDVPVICEIINDAARAYQGVIPADRWHEPYMPLPELQSEIARGVRFYGCDLDGRLTGVMGIQDVKDVTLIRHAYVRTDSRGRGIGRSLIEHASQLAGRPCSSAPGKRRPGRCGSMSGTVLRSSGKRTGTGS
jgi:GNAT superfamily N-acetyltransferase